MNKKIAVIVSIEKRSSEGYPGKMGESVVYHLQPPLESTRWDNDEDAEVTNQYAYVCVSQAGPLRKWETLIVPANKAGEVIGWFELDGSRRGFVTPDNLMRKLGYEVIGRS